MTEPNEIHYKQRAQVKSNSLNVVKLVCSGTTKFVQIVYWSTNLATNFAVIKVHTGTRRRQ